MRKPKIVILHAYDVQPEVRTEASTYCPSGMAYIAQGLENPNEHLVDYLRSVRDAEKQMNEWIRKYQNVLDGLNYWKAKALGK